MKTKMEINQKEQIQNKSCWVLSPSLLIQKCVHARVKINVQTPELHNKRSSKEGTQSFRR